MFSVCRYDKFRDRYLVGAHELQEFAGEFSDHAERILRDETFRRFGFDPGELNTNRFPSARRTALIRCSITSNRYPHGTEFRG